MKKFLSILCALSMLCGFASVSYAGGDNLYISSTFALDETWTSKDKVTQAGDVLGVVIAADGIGDMSNIASNTEVLTTLQFHINYNRDALKAFPDSEYDLESYGFAAKYSMPNMNKPTASTEGNIYTKGYAPSVTPNLDQGVFNGVTLLEATKGFAVKGDFITFYFEVLDPSKSADLSLEVVDVVDFALSKLTTQVTVSETPVQVDGMGGSTPVAPVVGTVNADTTENYWNVDEQAEKYTQGYDFEVTPNDGFNAIKFDFGNSKTFTWDGFTTFTGDTPVSFGLNINNVPDGTTIPTPTVSAYIAG